MHEFRGPSNTLLLLLELTASSLKKSRKLLTVDNKMEPLTRMVLASSRCSSYNTHTHVAVLHQPFPPVFTQFPTDNTHGIGGCLWGVSPAFTI